ncbi:MAG: HNH endonuclease [Sinimarinibacterium flocculans]|uniref:HNH endonuclease n=1 Tax=Sinimarinibacterium flocculans TaxID=985250 RepID=UPI003C473E02
MSLPILVTKALADTGYDMIAEGNDGWFLARVSGSAVRLAVQPIATGTILAVPEPGLVQRIGLETIACTPPVGMTSAGLASSPVQLYQGLRMLHSLQTHPASVLSATLEARLAEIPETERTREVRQRIGQDVFREALMELWEGRCALSGIALPPALLRASHAKPWAKSRDDERLDPFNGLLLAVQFDALFDQGFIAFDDEGLAMISSQITADTRQFLKLDELRRLRFVLPGHREYLRYHRAHVFQP